jgi:hypothetical protein
MRTFTPENNSHTGSRENLKLASMWLQRCLETHPNCNTDRIEAPTLPTRVIDVGPPDGSRPPFLFLTNNSRGVYVTLSHCWGRIPFITTSSATLAAREAAIPLRDMPKTFQHAVYVSRTLRVRYLWIDSLCILQDSKRDWEIESSRMADYYTNALLTIAADDASDATKGCFRTRHIGDNKPVEVQLRFKEVPADKDARHYVRRLPPSLPLDGRNDARSVLQTRGWVYRKRFCRGVSWCLASSSCRYSVCWMLLRSPVLRDGSQPDCPCTAAGLLSWRFASCYLGSSEGLTARLKMKQLASSQVRIPPAPKKLPQTTAEGH